MVQLLMIIWHWMISAQVVPVGRNKRTRAVTAFTRPRPLIVTKFVYPCVVIGGQNSPLHYWSRDAIERSNALDSTMPTGPMRAWLKAIHQVENQS